MSRFRSSAVIPVIAAACVLGATAAAAQVLEDLSIVSAPTAGVLPHGGYRLFGSVGPGSSILASVAVGFFDRLMLGASFGIQDVIGRGNVSVNDRVGLALRLRILEETMTRPAFTFGIDTQGEGRYLENDERYERKSRGVFLVLGKNYRFIEELSLNGGVNYSFENRDEEDLNVFGGIEIGLVPWLGLLLDYDAAFDDNDEDLGTARTKGRGYLDAGVCLDYQDNLRFKVLFKDLLDNYRPQSGVYRAIEVYYIDTF